MDPEDTGSHFDQQVKALWGIIMFNISMAQISI